MSKPQQKSRIGKKGDDIFKKPPPEEKQEIIKETQKVECSPVGVKEEETSSRGRPQEHKESFSKVTVILLDRQVNWLDQLTLDIRSKTKYSASRAEILRAMIDAIQESEIDLSIVKSEAETKQIILSQIKKA